jgi:MFS family permease
MQRKVLSLDNPLSLLRSAFVDASVSFVHALMCFIFGRYTSGLGDYLGRKPILIASTLAFIATRLIYLSAQTASGFVFGAMLGGVFDCVYFTCLAWVCDLFPEGTRRSKRVGLFTGVVGGLAFVVGVPAGALIAQRGLELPLKMAMCGGFLCLLILLVLPVDDTLGIKIPTPPADETVSKGSCFGTRRHLPPSWKTYLWANFPVNSHAYELILKAKFPLDWLTNFLMHTTSGLLNLILIQYCLAVFDWSAVLASAAVLSVGICLGLFAPALLHRFDPVPLAFYAMISFTLGHALLSVSGTGLSIAPLIGVLGIVCIAMGTSWVPALQTNILSQYSADVQVLLDCLCIFVSPIVGSCERDAESTERLISAPGLPHESWVHSVPREGWRWSLLARVSLRYGLSFSSPMHPHPHYRPQSWDSARS